MRQTKGRAPLQTCVSRKLVFLLLVLVARTAARAAAAADPDPPVPTEEEFVEAKLEIWRASIEAVIDNELTTMCRLMIRAVKTEGETPRTACTQLRDNKFLMRLSCSASDVEHMEEAVCSYWSIVLPSGTASLTTPPAFPPAEERSGLAGVNESSFSSSSFSPSSAAGELPSSSPSSPLSSPTNSSLPDETLAAVVLAEKIPDINRQQREIISQDSRLSKACNRILSPLASALAADENSTRSGCQTLLNIAQFPSSAADDSQPRSDPNSPEVAALRTACSQEDLTLLHEILCAHVRDNDVHALKGKKQKHVRYVIETELSATCSQALSPLGQGQVKEDARDSCRTLGGSEGDELVANQVCTRHDLDNLLEAVCDAAPNVVSLNQQTFLLTVVSLLTYVYRTLQAS